MPQETSIEKSKSAYRCILILMLVGTILAAIKLIFVELCQDEEYQIVMAYRRAMGDRLFADMWEPHQMSSFLNTLFIRMFVGLTGSTTGIVVFLRIMGTMIQFLIAGFLYLTALRNVSRQSALLVSLIWFNSSMGLFISPEYSSMMFWFGTLSILCFWNAMEARHMPKRQGVYVILGDICMCLGVLSYPGFAIFVGCIWIAAFIRLPRDIRGKGMLLLILPCVLFGIGYMLMHAATVSVPVFLRSLPYIFLQDPTHRITENHFWTDKLLGAGKELLLDGIITLILYVVAILLTRLRANRSGTKITDYHMVALASVLGLCVALIRWLLLGDGFECGQVQEIVAAIGMCLLLKGQEKREKTIYMMLLMGGFAMTFGGWLLSNMSLDSKWCFGILFHVGLLLMLLKHMQNEEKKSFFFAVAVIWIFFLIFAKGFMLRSGRETNNILSIRNICETGPARGILTDYMNAYIMDANFREWNEHVSDEDRVLIVSHTLQSNVILSYMFSNVEIADCAVNNPYEYNKRLLDYWSLHPEKYPNVIAVDCWYGEELIDPDEWIMEYIRNDYGYTEVQDGAYLRYYRKKD
ncbi:MAG: hypothetical protein K6A92_01085 [Lachnospiraceae bacterium]|nr:hypothetical protein [Lachnospiraceae bacterium]